MSIYYRLAHLLNAAIKCGDIRLLYIRFYKTSIMIFCKAAKCVVKGTIQIN